MNSADKGASARRRGRPRDVAVDSRITLATLEELARVGYAELSMDRVAVRAGVARSSIYRRWPSKSYLVVDALSRNIPEWQDPNTNDPVDDLITMVCEFVIGFTTSGYGAVAMAIHAEAHRDPHLNALVHDYLTPRGKAIDDVVSRGQSCGALTTELSHGMIRDLLVGPALYRWFIPKEESSVATVRTLVTFAVSALTVQ